MVASEKRRSLEPCEERIPGRIRQAPAADRTVAAPGKHGLPRSVGTGQNQSQHPSCPIGHDMPPRPCPLPCSDAHEPTDRSLPPPDHQQDPARLRDRRRPRNLVTRTRHCATILTTLIVSTAALTACTRAEAEPPVAQTPSEASPTTAVTSTPGPAKATVKLTEMPEDPETQAALMAYARFEQGILDVSTSGGSSASLDQTLKFTHPDGDAATFAKKVANLAKESGPTELTGPVTLSSIEVSEKASHSMTLDICMDRSDLQGVPPGSPAHLRTHTYLVIHETHWVVSSYRNAEDQSCV